MDYTLKLYTAPEAELSVFNPPQGQTCGQYLADWLMVAPGQLYNPSATQDCQYCAFTNADQYMALSKICMLYPHLPREYPIECLPLFVVKPVLT